MRDLLKRLDRIERATPRNEDCRVVILRFVPGEPNAIRCGSTTGDAVRRDPGEPLEAFYARAEQHFAVRRLTGVLTLLAMEEADA